jgi:hypothetical protein
LGCGLSFRDAESASLKNDKIIKGKWNQEQLKKQAFPKNIKSRDIKLK